MSAHNSPEIANQINRVEVYARYGIDCTLRLIKELSWNLGFFDSAELVRYISGKMILDVGSGYNGLAIDVILQGIPAEVTSVNPGILRPGFEQEQKAEILLAYGVKVFGSYSLEEIERARKIANSNTYSCFAHDLGFPDSVYERVIDSNAIFSYATFRDRPVFMQSARELYRVCGETIRVSDPMMPYGMSIPNWKEEVLMELGFEFKPSKYGVEICKGNLPCPV